MAWVLRVVMGLALALAGSAALAERGGYYEAPPSYDELSPSYGYARQHYAGGEVYDHGYDRAPPCRCGDGADHGGGEVAVPYSFFHDTGGVGPIPSDGYGYGGGYSVVGGGGFSSARASSSASASARASVSVRGGHHSGGCCHK